MAVDDWLAILFLLGRSELDVRAITVTGAGEAHCEPGVRHARELTALAGRPDLPVACGREAPIAGEHAFPAGWRDAVDALVGLDLPDVGPAPDVGSAVDLLGRVVDASPEPVTVLALGPLTNLADAFAAQPDLPRRLGDVVIMGGAVEVPGNVGESGAGIDNPHAEWNIYVDPVAARTVLRSDAPVTLVPLDATNHAKATPAFLDRLAADRTTPSAQFAYEALAARRGELESGFYYFWDPLAAATLVDATLTTFEERPLDVVVDEGPESGRIIPADGGRADRFATTADGPRFEQLFLDALNGRS